MVVDAKVWDPEIKAELRKKLLPLLPANGAWVSLMWLMRVAQERHLVTPSQCSAYLATVSKEGKGLPAREQVEWGLRRLIADIMSDAVASKKFAADDGRAEQRQFRRVVVGYHTPEELPPVGQVRKVSRSSFRRSKDMRVRPKSDPDRQTLMAEAMKRGESFPPVLVVQDAADGTLWLVDGFKRDDAAEEAGIEDLEAEVRVGTREQAVLLATRGGDDTAAEGWTPKDRKRAAALVIRAFGQKWTDTRVANWVGLSDKTVKKVRARVVPSDFPKGQGGKRQAENGQWYSDSRAKVSPDLHRQIEEMLADGQSLNSIHKALGVSRNTIRDIRDGKRQLPEEAALLEPPEDTRTGFAWLWKGASMIEPAEVRERLREFIAEQATRYAGLVQPEAKENAA